MGLILDLAVAALALLVIGSLALLTWTLAFSAVRVRSWGCRRVARLRRDVAQTEGRLRSGGAATSAVLADLAARTTPTKPGDGPDA